jgi:hypothetical protein
MDVFNSHFPREKDGRAGRQPAGPPDTFMNLFLTGADPSLTRPAGFLLFIWGVFLGRQKKFR